MTEQAKWITVEYVNAKGFARIVMRRLRRNDGRTWFLWNGAPVFVKPKATRMVMV